MSNGRQLHFSVTEDRSADSISREVVLKADGSSDEICVLYEIFDTTGTDIGVLDGLVQGVLLHCMQRGLPLRIHGNISRSAAYNLHELQRFWVRWKPKIYRHIDLLPDAIVTEHPKSGRAIQAFSGGVDATFTLISGKYLNTQRGAYDINAAMLVHGFDVAYDNKSDFTKVVERARKTLDHAGVDLKIVRTNSRSLKLQSWHDSTSLQLSACLHQFSDRYSIALMGSAAPYDGLSMPTGSNPMSDHLLSGDLMTAIHDGAGYSRTEKVEAISKMPFLVDSLRVCWEGTSQYRNCGRCEKCLRTRLNFAAVGHNEPSCFPGPFKTAMLWKLRARAQIQIAELEGILAYVLLRQLSYPWVNALRRQILISRIATTVEHAIGWPKLKTLLRSIKHRLNGRTRHGGVRA